MTLAANTQLATAGRATFAVDVVDGDILYAGAYTAIGSRDHGTAANRGVAQPMLDDTEGLVPVGFCDQQITGLAAGTPPPEASISVEGKIVRGVTITDDAGDSDDVMRLVYLLTDNTFSLSRPSTIGFPIGITTRFRAVNEFDVYFFSLGEMVAISLGGGGRVTWCIGSFMAELGITTANLLTGIVCPFHGYITDYYMVCGSAPADSDVAGLVGLEIDGVDFDFGTSNPAVAAADTVGLKISGVGALVATVVHEGDLIDVEGVFSAAGTVGDGLYSMFIDIELQPGT